MKRTRTSKNWMSEHTSDSFVKQAQKDGYRSRAAYKVCSSINISEKAPSSSGRTARALASTTLAATVIAQLINGEQAVIPALDLIDTIKEVDSKGYVRNTPDRSTFRSVQTPQGFSRSVLERAHAASQDATDDAALVGKS